MPIFLDRSTDWLNGLSQADARAISQNDMRPKGSTENSQTNSTALHNDSPECSTNPHDMIYFAVGHRVYRQPMENIAGLFAYGSILAKQMVVPSPPKPQEPQGCPDHPIQAMGY